MPTPVSTAKQCLNAEASHALDEAVTVARRRGHAQTTSLHAVSALLSLSPSQLREACVRGRNAAFNPRLQQKVLDFRLSVSLDRLPASQARVDEPPISNSLMAAIRRSQANQRRHPDTLITLNKPQFQQLGQDQLGASSGIKVELQNLIVSILDDPIVSRVFNDAGFSSLDVKLAILRPFQSFFRYPPQVRGPQNLFFGNFNGHLDPGYRPLRFPFSGNWENRNEDGSYRRIGEVLIRKKGRNPLLIGLSSGDVLRGFMEVLDKKKESGLPLEIRGINTVSIDKDILKFMSENWSEEAMSLKFREVGLMVENSLGPGLVVSLGNLRCFVGGEKGFRMDMMNSVVTKLTKLLEIHGGRVWLICFADDDRTYIEFLSRFPSIAEDWDLQFLQITSVKPSMGDSCFKSSLMGSFVPFGGFFSSPSDQHQGALSPWLQMAELGVNPCPRGSVSQEQAMNTFDNLKAKGSTRLRSDTMVGPQRKWDNLCQCHHHNQPSFEPEIRGKCFELPTAVGFHHLENKAKNFNDGSNFTGNSSCKECDHGKITPCKSMNLRKHSTSQSSNPVFRSSKTDRPHSPSSGVSMTTDLGLELFSQPCKQQKKANPVIECSNHAFFDLADENNFKTLYKALFGRLGRQCEAVRTISQIVSHSWKSNAMNQTSPLRGDIWLNFIGPDILGKRKIASTLAEILYGSKNNLIHVDLCYDCGEKVFGHREKTIVDHIAEELHKTPRCVVFLENVHSADLLAQRSLLKAFRSGRFSDSHGREVTVDNRIFVLTSKKPFSEERIARSKGWPLQIVVKDCEKFHNQMISNKRKLSGKAQTSRMSLDLNLPAETSEPHEPESESWLEEFSGQVDKTLVKVVFDPFDYDTLAMRVSKLVHESFREVFGSNFLLEVEPSVIDQMVAAVCLSEREKEVEDWIERVLSKGFVEAQKRYQFTDHSIVVISVCQALFMEEKVSQPCLPSKIILT